MAEALGVMESKVRETDVLILGAGPFGLALASHLRDLGIDFALAGRPMSFWQENMPAGMLLRSGLDWHLDTAEVATLEAYVGERGLTEAEEVLPLSRDRYLDYVQWFAGRKGLRPVAENVESLMPGEDSGFVAETESGVIRSRAVVVATGFREHAYLPVQVTSLLPEGTYGHTCDIVDFGHFTGRSVVVVGGRQSAFESAVLIAEAGARAVHVVHRHDTPEFKTSDWSWVEPLMRRTEREPGWYEALPEEERAALNARFWAEGRRKLEPWLYPRLVAGNVRLWPNQTVASAVKEGGGLTLTLSAGDRLEADFVLFATGYRYELQNLPFLSRELSARIEVRNGFPILDGALQSSVEGLYFTSMAATQDFGPFFAFTVSARCSARLIGASLQEMLGDS